MSDSALIQEIADLKEKLRVSNGRLEMFENRHPGQACVASHELRVVKAALTVAHSESDSLKVQLADLSGAYKLAEARLAGARESYAEMSKAHDLVRRDWKEAYTFNKYWKERAEKAEAEVASLKAEADRMREAKDGAYSERNKLVAALSKLFPSSVERHEGAEREDDWRNVVFIDLPAGQVSWHILDSEAPQFAHLPKNAGRKWDGHTTEQKYERLAAICDGWHCAVGCKDHALSTKPESQEKI